MYCTSVILHGSMRVSQIKILHIFLVNLVQIGSVELCHFLVKDEMVS